MSHGLVSRLRCFFVVLVMFVVCRSCRADTASGNNGVAGSPAASNAFSGTETAYNTGSITPISNYIGWVAFEPYNSSWTINGSAGTRQVNLATELPSKITFNNDGSQPTIQLITDTWTGPSFTMLGNGRFTSYNLTSKSLIFGCDSTITSSILLGDKIIINGNKHTITLGSGGCFQVDGSATATLRNMNLVVKTSTPFRYGDSASKLFLQNVNIYLDPVLNGGSVYTSGNNLVGLVTILGTVTINGAGQVFEHSTVNATGFNTAGSSLYIEDNSTLVIGSGVTFTMSRDVANNNNKKLMMRGTGSALVLNNCAFRLPTVGITSPGLQLERGMVVFDNHVLIDNEGNTDANKGLVLGDGVNAANDVAVKVCSGAQVVVDGFLFHRPA